MNLLKKIFANFDLSKTEEQDDGTIKVWGYASADTEDSDGEIITADAMKAALPGYMKWGAVREMHQAKAAGTAIEAEVQDDGKTWFGAHVVDTEAVKKVKAGVYKGFSIGGKVTARDELNKSVIKGLNLIEVSLVDRPANPDAVFTMYKAEGLEEEPAGEISAVDQLAELLNKGEVTPERLLELAKGEAKVVGVGAGTEGFGGAVADALKTAGGLGGEFFGEDDIKKGLYGVSRFAELLQSVAYLAEDTAWEAQYEGDNSPLPEALRGWLSAGAEILKAMAEEEINELLASLAPAVESMKAAKADDIAKAGAKFSKATKGALAAIHKAAKDACEHLDKLGYEAAEESEEEADKVAKAEQLSKAAEGLKAIGETLQKAGVVKEDDLLIDGINKVLAEREDLQKRVAELEAKPAQGKALLKAIAKAADSGEAINDTAEKVDPVKDHKGEVDEVATLIKSIHSGKAA